VTVWIVLTESGSKYEIDSDSCTVTRHAQSEADVLAAQAASEPVERKKRFGRRSKPAQDPAEPMIASDRAETQDDDDTAKTVEPVDMAADAAAEDTSTVEMRWKYTRMQPQFPAVGITLEFIGTEGKWVTTTVTKVTKK